VRRNEPFEEHAQPSQALCQQVVIVIPCPACGALCSARHRLVSKGARFVGAEAVALCDLLVT
jgi:hypothetical protein